MSRGQIRLTGPKREIMPGNLKGADLENYIRDAASTYWHQTFTAKMGRDPMSVVDGHLKVHRIENLRTADRSIMPRVTSGNTMAPCVIIGERAAEILREEPGVRRGGLAFDVKELIRQVRKEAKQHVRRE
jgi:choline dehydrogenase